MSKVVKEAAKKKIKKCAILGTVPHKMKAPFANKDFEIWAIAHACLGDPIPRADRIFEIHKWEEIIQWKSDLAWKFFPNAKVYLREARPELPNAVIFPFDDIAKKFNIFDDRKECLQTNSISWMIAMAIDEGFEEIHVYGVNMSHNTEYGTQKPSCEYYLGLAKGRGIKIYIPEESDLCKSFFHYGRQEEETTDIGKKIDDRILWLQGQYNMMANQAAFLMQAANQMVGHIEGTRAWMAKLKEKNDDKFTELIADMEAKGIQLTQEFQAKQQEAQMAANSVQQLVGGIEDCKYWRMTLKH